MLVIPVMVPNKKVAVDLCLYFFDHTKGEVTIYILLPYYTFRKMHVEDSIRVMFLDVPNIMILDEPPPLNNDS